MNTNKLSSPNPLQERITHLKSRIINGDYSDLSSNKCILAQYRICAWVLSDYFATIPNQFWEVRGDGVGMCWNNDWEFDNWHVQGSTNAKNIEEIRSTILQDIWLSIYDPSIRACIYHREWVGCILWDLKSPRCVTEPDGDISKKYNSEKLRDLFSQIELAGWTPEWMFQDESPENNWWLVIDFLEEVESYL